MNKNYDSSQLEQKWYTQWEQANVFQPSNNAEQSYSIVLPPPNVTGTLHMGHAFQDTLMDILIRYNRMTGKNTLWQVGTDHAGIATQMVVERQCQADGITRHELGREAFLDRIWDWKEKSGGAIERQMKRLGASADWETQRFTLDPKLSEAVADTFETLYDEGLIYRGKRLVNWDPKLKTAVSDLEVITEEVPGELVHMRYRVEGSSDFIIVATTRPETLFGDVAVAVHPEDERYKALIGKRCILPIQGRTIPIIADDAVLMDFGTGCVKITPAHDFTDNEIGTRHNLPLINILNDDASLNSACPEGYAGLDRFVARAKVLSALDSEGLLDKREAHQVKLPKGDRSGEILEPYLTDQWFVKVEPLAKPAIAAVKNGDVKFVPQSWENTYFDWMNNIQDWCISRQLWWGHRIPAWYDESGKVYVGKDEAAVRAKYSLEDAVVLHQDEDVLDTWFSSALWPFSSIGWPHDPQRVEAFYPTSVLVTGFDIIFFWVARMIMFGLKFMDKAPFPHVYVHGLIQDSHGQKMSKSKGNVIDPIDLIDGIELEAFVTKRTTGLMQPKMAAKIEKTTRKDFPDGIPAFGTDAVRFNFCAMASSNRHLRFDLARLEGYRNFINKLWNASRYVLMQLESTSGVITPCPEQLSVCDHWILSCAENLIEECDRHIAQYRFDLLAQVLYEFTWNTYCDWYLELTKATLQDDAATTLQKQATLHTLVNVLDLLCERLHPVIPFVTEEIALAISPYCRDQPGLLATRQCKQGNPELKNETAQASVEFIKSVIVGLRNIRGELNISPGKPITLLCRTSDVKIKGMFESNQAIIQKLAKLDAVRWVEADEVLPPAATAIAGELTLYVPLEGLVDIEAELSRAQKEHTRLSLEIKKLESKLGNKQYVDKAPPEVVTQSRDKLNKAKDAAEKLQAVITDLEKIR